MSIRQTTVQHFSVRREVGLREKSEYGGKDKHEKEKHEKEKHNNRHYHSGYCNDKCLFVNQA